MGFISDFIKHTQIYESPTSFWQWAAYATIAATLRDNVWMGDGDDKLYPNIYVLFYAKSGSRKGRPVKLAHKLLNTVKNTKVIAGRASIQAILDEIAHTETDAKTGKIQKAGAAIFLAEELSSGLVGDDAAIGILTDIYDGKTDFGHRLRHSPKFHMDSLVFTALMASNEVLVKGLFGQAGTYGGLLGRTFLIMPDEFRSGNSLSNVNTKELENGRASLESSLREIAKLSGMMSLNDSGQQAYDEWYYPFRKSYQTRKDTSGVVERLHTGVKKLAMIFAADGGNVEIGDLEIHQAIDTCIKLIPNYNSFLMASGKSTISEAGGLVLPELYDSVDHLMPRNEILRRHWQDFDDDVLTKLVTALEGGGIIKTIMSGNAIFYQLTEKGVQMMTKGEGGSK